MTPASRRLLVAIATILAVALSAVACGPGAATSTPTAAASPSPTPTATPTAPAASATASTSEAPSASASAATACTSPPVTIALPSDRFTGITIVAGPTSDVITFIFGNPSLPGPAAPPKGALTMARQPYSQAGSGATIDMAGDHVLQVTFTGMSLQNDAGQETYSGLTELKPDLRAVQQAVLYDASEGVIGWYIGYDGEGCVTLADDGSNVTITIAHS